MFSTTPGLFQFIPAGDGNVALQGSFPGPCWGSRYGQIPPYSPTAVALLLRVQLLLTELLWGLHKLWAGASDHCTSVVNLTWSRNQHRSTSILAELESGWLLLRFHGLGHGERLNVMSHPCLWEHWNGKFVRYSVPEWSTSLLEFRQDGHKAGRSHRQKWLSWHKEQAGARLAWKGGTKAGLE